MKNFKNLRIAAHLSQQELADILHVSQQSIYKYENDITTPDIHTLIAMADHFHTSVDYLIDHTDISHRIEPVTECHLNELELKELKEFRGLSSENQELFLQLMKKLNCK